MCRRAYRLRAASLIFSLAALSASVAWGWTPMSQTAIATAASHLAPPDLARQIERHRRAFEAGVAAPFAESDPGRHMKNADGSGGLDRVALREIQGAIDDIRSHRPFEDVVRRPGTVSHFLADANNPLATADSDSEEGRYFADFLRYAESAETRFPVIFYGLPPKLEANSDLSGLISQALRRGRELYPFIGREYRRIDFASGRGRFDDRSSAFGVASISFSHAVSDVAVALRYIWLRAGGVDDRKGLLLGGSRLRVLPRPGAAAAPIRR